MKTAIAFRHIAVEDAGTLAPALERAGYELTYLEAWRDDLSPGLDADLLIVLGGPIGAYEEGAFPFLTAETGMVQQRLAADRPTLGLCLGSQIMAKALGAAVYPGGKQEIGWAPLSRAEGILAPLRDLPVLHWHGDTFDLPPGCELLASSRLYERQAFARGRNVLALQFHIEVDAIAQEAWLVANAGQLAGLGLDPAALRRDAALYAKAAGEAGDVIFDRWLAGL